MKKIGKILEKHDAHSEELEKELRRHADFVKNQHLAETLKKSGGFKVITEGNLLVGDLVYNNVSGRFDEILIDGTVTVQQCYLVIRKIGSN